MEKVLKLDLRKVPVTQRHPMIFDSWEGLKPESVLQIVNDHDPKPLRYHFESEYKDKFEWAYLASGPEEWVVNITKLKPYESKGEELRGKVMAGLDKVRPHLQADGGDVELIEIDDEAMIVRVKLKGACGTCPSAAMTLKSGVEAQIKKIAPEIRSVESVQVPAEQKAIEKPKAAASCCDHEH